MNEWIRFDGLVSGHDLGQDGHGGFAVAVFVARIQSFRTADDGQREPQEGEAEVSRLVAGELRERRFHVRRHPQQPLLRGSGTLINSFKIDFFIFLFKWIFFFKSLFFKKKF